METNKPVVIVSCNDDFVIPTMVMLKSICKNTTREIEVYFIDGGLSKQSKYMLQINFSDTKLSINYIKFFFDTSLNLKTSTRIPIETYYRLFLPDLLPDNVKKVIYLDGDLILRSDISYLWEHDISDYALLAVRDMWIGTQYVSSEKGISMYKELEIPQDQFYFNAGVLVINIELWRKNRYKEKILAYLAKYNDQVIYHDQDGLNAVLWDKWQALPEEWNVMGIVFAEDQHICCLDAGTLERIKKNPQIIHFSGPQKPWIKGCNNPYKTEYFEYYNELIIEI